MDTIKLLMDKIESLSEKDYGAYQSLKGEYNYPEFKLFIDQIPKDPYAPPHTGIYRAKIKNTFINHFDSIFNTKVSEIAFCDYLSRNFYDAALKKNQRKKRHRQ